jgi:hypothetical protein
MLNCRLNDREVADLRAAHRAAREAYRLIAVILLASGWMATQIAEALLVECESVRNCFKRYCDGVRDALVRMSDVGGEALLTASSSPRSMHTWISSYISAHQRQRCGGPTVTSARCWLRCTGLVYGSKSRKLLGGRERAPAHSSRGGVHAGQTAIGRLPRWGASAARPSARVAVSTAGNASRSTADGTAGNRRSLGTFSGTSFDMAFPNREKSNSLTWKR